MTDSFKAMEAELRALRAREPSPQLRQRIAEQLVTGTVESRRRRWPLALAASIAMACGATVVSLLRDSNQRDVATTRSTEIAAANVLNDSMPSAWVYQRALRGSSEALNALLVKHSGKFATTDVRPANLDAFMRSDTEFNHVLGEL